MDGILRGILAARARKGSEYDDPDLEPVDTPSLKTFGRALAGLGLDALTPGPGAPGLAAMLAAPDEPEVLAEGNDEIEVNRKLSDIGVSPQNAEILFVRDNDSGKTQAVLLKRSNVSDEQAREWRYQDAMEAIQLEVEERNRQMDEHLKQLELTHSSVMQDYDRAMRLTRDPQMRGLWAQSKERAERHYMQALGQKQRERQQLNLVGTQLVTEYVRDRYRGGSRIPPDEYRERRQIDYDFDVRTAQAKGELQLANTLKELAERHRIDRETMLADTTVRLYRDQLTAQLDILSDPRSSSSRRQEAQDRYNEIRNGLDGYLKIKFGAQGQAGTASKGNGSGQGGGSAPNKERVVFTASNGVRLIESPAGREWDYPKRMGKAGFRRALAEYQAKFGK